MSTLFSIFCDINDFCKDVEPILEAHLLASGI